MPWSVRPAPEVAARILGELFADDAGGGEAGGVQATLATRRFPLAPFQEAGVRRIRALLDRHGGAVLADSVGLGKTYMALALIEEALAAGTPVTVAVPAALRPTWRPLLRRLQARGAGAGSGGPAAAGPVLVSHAALSRGSYPSALAGRGGVVVVDEAHRFRNPETRRYAALEGLCADARVALLTATPVNNSAADLYWLLRLFADDDAFVDLGIASLAELFGIRSAAPGSAAPRASGPVRTGALHRLMGEIVVRRTRSLVGGYPAAAGHPAPVRFPVRAPPSIVRYHDPRIPDLVAGIEALELVACGGTAPALLRLGLLKRLESGAAALAASVARQLAFARSCHDAAGSGLRLRPRQLRVGPDAGDRDPLQLVLFDLVADPWPPGEDRAAAMASLARDIHVLDGMARLLEGPDPKLAALLARVGALAPEKVLVFTEYRDTAEALWRALVPARPSARIDGGGAWLGPHPAGRRTVVERFAPAASGAPGPPERERVAVLVATDVLAEGMNLQDARHVVSYDLPWNPVRLMQRIGRVDRLGSPHHTVVPHLFLPATGLDAVLGLTRRLARKLGDIAATVGAEDAIELLTGLDRGGDEAAAALQAVEARGEDPVERVRSRWAGRGAPDEGATAPGRPLLARAPDGIPTIALVRAGSRPWLLELRRDGTLTDVTPDALDALDRLAGARAAPAASVTAPDTARDVDPRHVRRLLRRVRAHYRAVAARAAAPPPVGRLEPAALMARRIRDAIEAAGITAPPEQVARADRLILALGRPLPPTATRRARQALDDGARDLELDALLGRAEAAVGEPGGPAGGIDPTPVPPPRPGSGPRLVAALIAPVPGPCRSVDHGGGAG